MKDVERELNTLEFSISKAGKGYFLQCEQFVPQSLEKVFEFFANAHNLEKITPAFLQFAVLTPPPIEMRAGATIDYRIKLHGLPIKWRSEIAVWEPPHRFVDQQLRGPYRRWVHEHSFIAKNGGTLITDKVVYGVPGGPLVHALLVKKDLREIFRYRAQAIEKIMESLPFT